MTYTVTFFATMPRSGRVVAREHRVEASALPAYRDVPKATLRAIRIAEPTIVVDGFRIEDENGHVVLDYVEDGGRL